MSDQAYFNPLVLLVLEPGKKRGRFNRGFDLLADGIGYIVGAAVIVATAAYPIYLAVQSGTWWAILLAVIVIGGGAVAMLFAAFD